MPAAARRNELVKGGVISPVAFHTRSLSAAGHMFVAVRDIRWPPVKPSGGPQHWRPVRRSTELSRRLFLPSSEVPKPLLMHTDVR